MKQSTIVPLLLGAAILAMFYNSCARGFQGHEVPGGTTNFSDQCVDLAMDTCSYSCQGTWFKLVNGVTVYYSNNLDCMNNTNPLPEVPK